MWLSLDAPTVCTASASRSNLAPVQCIPDPPCRTYIRATYDSSYSFALFLLQHTAGNGSEAQQTGQHVEVRGWVRTVRQQKQFAFMQVKFEA